MGIYKFSVVVEKDRDGYFASRPELQGDAKARCRRIKQAEGRREPGSIYRRNDDKKRTV